MDGPYTEEEKCEINVWLTEASNRTDEMLRAGLEPHYITAGSRVWWLLTQKGTYEKPVLGTIPVFPMNPAAMEFPEPPEGIRRPLHGIAVVAR